MNVAGNEAAEDRNSLCPKSQNSAEFNQNTMVGQFKANAPYLARYRSRRCGPQASRRVLPGAHRFQL
jgi:hypothetical protein